MGRTCRCGTSFGSHKWQPGNLRVVQAIGRERGPLRGGGIRAMAAGPTDLLAEVGLFSDLSKRELKDIAGSIQEHRCSAGSEVVTAGKGGAAFFIIADGKAAVIRADKEVATLGPGDYFGEIALVTGGERNASVTALTDLSCWTLSAWAFRSTVKTNASIAWKLLVQIGRQIERA